MQLRPHYGEPPLLRIDTGPEDPGVPLANQRRRLAELLAGLEVEQWAAPSRCEGWSVQEVITHLVSTNQFWAFSVTAAVGGNPTRVLDGFDPVATPADLVAAAGGVDPAVTLEQFVESNEALMGAVSLVEDWDLIGEAPPGHLPLRAVALHALWDAWVHERDVLLPLGLTPTDDPEEVAATLHYAAALSPLFELTMQGPRAGSLAVDASDLDLRFVVTVDDVVVIHDGDAPPDALRLGGPAVELVEALSRRLPLRVDVRPEQGWLVDGLATVFDQG